MAATWRRAEGGHARVRRKLGITHRVQLSYWDAYTPEIVRRHIGE